jgi:hypothetical protein
VEELAPAPCDGPPEVLQAAEERTWKEEAWLGPDPLADRRLALEGPGTPAAPPASVALRIATHFNRSRLSARWLRIPSRSDSGKFRR